MTNILEHILHSNAKYIYFLIAFTVPLILFYQSLLNKLPVQTPVREKPQKIVVFSSECDCRINESYIFIAKNASIQIKRSSDNNTLFSNLDFKSLSLTCDLYNSFRRGNNTKVIGYSLYGRNPTYSNLLPVISKSLKAIYPDWLMRVYYDNSINPDLKCKLECLKDDKGQLIDNIDFCNVNKLPMTGSLYKTWDAKAIHAMEWRWFPIGDTFVNSFMSRDTDSTLIQREIDSVNVWLASNKSAHIMRGSNQSNFK